MTLVRYCIRIGKFVATWVIVDGGILIYPEKDNHCENL